MATSPLSDDHIVLFHAVYPEECLKAACEKYERFLKIEVKGGDGFSVIALNPTADTASDPVTARREFLNFALDLSIQRHLAS